MEIFAETDNTTKNIVQEILRESLRKNIEIDNGFCTYYVKLLILDPVWGISPQKKSDRIMIQALVSWIIRKFADVECLSLKIMKMQQYFMSKYTARENLIKDHYDLINSIVEPLLKSIVDITAEYMQNNKSRILKRMTLYIIMASKMGDIKDNMVFRETFHALKSIINDDDLNEYVKMNKKDRRAEMIYKQKVVMGIRLFNSDCGRQTVSIEDLPKIIKQSANVMLVELQKELCYIMDIVNLTTTAIESVFVYSTSNQNTLLNTFEIEDHKAIAKLPEGTSYEDLKKIVNILVLARQHEVFLRKFLLDVKVIQKDIKVLETYLQEILNKLHQAVKFKVAVMASTVFPLFVDLGDVWIRIQEEAIIFSHLIQVFKYLKKVTKTVILDKDKITLMIGDNPIMTDAMRLEKTTGIRIGQLVNVDCKILDPLEIEDFENLHLEFLGFCIWKFILTKGALIPGNPNMGVLKWEDKHYVFSIPEAAAYFAQNPKKMVMNALIIARNKPELITLLQIQQQIYDIRNLEIQRARKSVTVRNILHKEIQTEIHPIESNIDKNYEWNTWKMLKEAILFADLSRRETISTQTILSNFKCNTSVQTINQRNKNEQTKKDNYSNTPKKSKYHYGLRGRKDNLQHCIELTPPMQEEILYKCASTNINYRKNEKRPYPTKPIKKSKSVSNKSLSIDKQKSSSSFELSDSLCVCELNLSVAS